MPSAKRASGRTDRGADERRGLELVAARGSADPLGAGPERCVLATKSLTAKLGVLLLTAYALADRFDDASSLLSRTASDVNDMLHGDRRAHLQAIAKALAAKDHLFVLGRGASYALALETALKIKEVSYIHAEGFASGDLKHGVIALIEHGTPCIALVPKDATESDVLAGALQVKARGATVIGISPVAHAAVRPSHPSRRPGRCDARRECGARAAPRLRARSFARTRSGHASQLGEERHGEVTQPAH